MWCRAEGGLELVKKVFQTSEKLTSLKILLLQLKLASGLSQGQEILLIYQEIILFLAKYSFIFENETSLKETDGELWAYEYDLSNRLTKVLHSENGRRNLTERASYTYDYRGLCVVKNSEDGTEYREYTADGKLIYTEKGENRTDYIYKSNTVFAEIRTEGAASNTYYHHTDHLGTTRAVSDENGAVVWEAETEAFGSVLSENGTKVFTASFTGKLYDEDAGMYYFNARWYDSELGRFVTQDPARDGVNWYAYCNGNPVKFIDPTGLYDEESGYTEQEIKDFKKRNVQGQLVFLKTEVHSVDSGTNSAGIKADFMRKQLKPLMKLDGLFYSYSGDETFMNEELREFLNLNLEGENNYSLTDVKQSGSGWFQMIPYLGDNEHQKNKNGGRNVKFCNKDGREAIFDAQGNYISDGHDAATYNYGYVANLNLSCIAVGSTHGQFDMKPFFRQNGKQPWYWNTKIDSNYGLNSR